MTNNECSVNNDEHVMAPLAPAPVVAPLPTKYQQF